MVHVFIRSDQDNAVYTTNTVYDFTCNLPRPLSNASGTLRVAVKQITMLRHYLAAGGVFVMTIDAVQPSPCFGREHQAVCCFTTASQSAGSSGQASETIDRIDLGPTPCYFKVLHNSVTRLRIQLKKDHLTTHARGIRAEELIKRLYIVLHFKS